MKKFENAGFWWNDDSIELVKLSDGNVYALNGFNGERYMDCWKCSGDHFMTASTKSYVLIPVYEEVEPDEWEIVDFSVY